MVLSSLIGPALALARTLGGTVGSVLLIESVRGPVGDIVAPIFKTEEVGATRAMTFYIRGIFSRDQFLASLRDAQIPDDQVGALLAYADQERETARQRPLAQEAEKLERDALRTADQAEDFELGELGRDLGDIGKDIESARREYLDILKDEETELIKLDEEHIARRLRRDEAKLNKILDASKTPVARDITVPSRVQAAIESYIADKITRESLIRTVILSITDEAHRADLIEFADEQWLDAHGGVFPETEAV